MIPVFKLAILLIEKGVLLYYDEKAKMFVVVIQQIGDTLEKYFSAYSISILLDKYGLEKTVDYIVADTLK